MSHLEFITSALAESASWGLRGGDSIPGHRCARLDGDELLAPVPASGIAAAHSLLQESGQSHQNEDQASAFQGYQQRRTR
jgi:hypothetical protein